MRLPDFVTKADFEWAVEEATRKKENRLFLGKAIICGDSNNLDDRVGAVTFNFSDISSYILAHNLSYKGGIALKVP